MMSTVFAALPLRMFFTEADKPDEINHKVDHAVAWKVRGHCGNVPVYELEGNAPRDFRFTPNHPVVPCAAPKVGYRPP